MAEVNIELPDSLSPLAPYLIAGLEDKSVVTYLAAYCCRFVRQLELLQQQGRLTPSGIEDARVEALIETELLIRDAQTKGEGMGRFAQRFCAVSDLTMQTNQSLNRAQRKVQEEFIEYKRSLPKKGKKDKE